MSIDHIGPVDLGFRWIVVSGIRYYSCYWSPNSTAAEFEDFMDRLENSVRGTGCLVVVAGDFNAKSHEW